MMRTFWLVAIGPLLSMLCGGIALAQTQHYPPQDGSGACFQAAPKHLAIAKGSVECKSSTYYQRIGNILSINFAEISLGEVAAHMGYDVRYIDRELETMIPAAVLDHTSPAMTEAQRYWHNQQKDQGNRRQVLVSRFFAPKIVNYSSTASRFDPGWRKLVYLPTQPGSAAELYGKLDGAYILFNYVPAARDRLADPFSAAGGDGHAISKNNQVILVPRDLGPQVKGAYRDTAFFAVYSGFVPGDAENSYRLLNTLEAGFDVPEDSGTTAYAVPDACAQCHGHDEEFGQAVTPDGAVSTNPRAGVYPFVKPNYLDTDQWYDAQRLDYGDLIGRLEPVFDGGTDRASARYRDAMDVIYRLNVLMRAQGAPAVRPPVGTVRKDEFQRAGVAKWLALHGAAADRVRVFAPTARLFPTTGAPVDGAKGELPLTVDRLSQFCFRCHSSIRFNVFDASYLQKSGSLLKGYVPDPMPLGRTLSAADATCLGALLDNVGKPASAGAAAIVGACNASFLMKGVSAEQSGYCYVATDEGFTDGARVMQGACDTAGYAERIWEHDRTTGRIRSASRPDRCLAVAPAYINRATRQIRETSFTGAEASYEFQPVVLKDCADPRADLRLRWKLEDLGKMAMIRSVDDPSLCLSGTDEYTTGPLTDAYAQSCRQAQPNGSFFIRTFEYTKGAALRATP